MERDSQQPLVRTLAAPGRMGNINDGQTLLTPLGTSASIVKQARSLEMNVSVCQSEPSAPGERAKLDANRVLHLVEPMKKNKNKLHAEAGQV